MVLWGVYPFCRRLSLGVGVVYFAIFHFLAELAVTAIISAASTREGNFSKVLTEDFSRAPHAVIMILTSGAITGSADVVFLSALKDLPSCVYQLTVGISLTSSIITSFLLDGNPNPMLLFTGLGLTLFSVLIQGLAYEDEKPKKASIAVDSVDVVSVAVNEDAADHQSRNSPECLIDAAAITIPDASDDGPGLAKPKVVRHSLFAGRTWVCILLVVTALKSGWHEYETMKYEGTDGDTIHAPMCSKGSVILERETDEGDECYVPELGGEAVRDLPGNAELVA
eukprot:g1073.t1